MIRGYQLIKTQAVRISWLFNKTIEKLAHDNLPWICFYFVFCNLVKKNSWAQFSNKRFIPVSWSYVRGKETNKNYWPFSPDWCSLVGWSIPQKNGGWSDSRSGPMPGWLPRALFGGMGEATNVSLTHGCLSLSLSPSLPFSQKKKWPFKKLIWLKYFSFID